jgi:hypothetical protein
VKYSLFVGICRVSKYAYIELHKNMTKETACANLDGLGEALSAVADSLAWIFWTRVMLPLLK